MCQPGEGRNKRCLFVLLCSAGGFLVFMSCCFCSNASKIFKGLLVGFLVFLLCCPGV